MPGWAVHCLDPVTLPPLEGATHLSVGEELACAALDDGTAWCWSMRPPEPTREELRALPIEGAHPVASAPPEPLRVWPPRGAASTTASRPAG